MGGLFAGFRITFCKFSTIGKVAAVFPTRDLFGFFSQIGIVANEPGGGSKRAMGPPGPLFGVCMSGFCKCGAYGRGGSGPLFVGMQEGGFLNDGGSGGGGPFVCRFSLDR